MYLRPKELLVLVSLYVSIGQAFWDEGTTTPTYIWPEMDDIYYPRDSFFRWIPPHWTWYVWWTYLGINDWCMASTAGISYGMHSVTVGYLLNVRTVITSANALEAYKYLQQDLRVWAPGLSNRWFTPYRYRVWRFRRILPRSNNAEHMLGPRGTYSFRHDIVIIHTWDQILLLNRSYYFFIAMKATLTEKRQNIVSDQHLFYTGSGFLTQRHVRESFRMYFMYLKRAEIRNCEAYLPKWWGKYICFVNNVPTLGVQAGSGLFTDAILIAIGAFEIRYNEDRIMVFTDLRYYVDHIGTYANITKGEYYDYAYQYWGTYEQHPYYYAQWHWHWNARVNFYRPSRAIAWYYYPLGKK